MSVKRELSQSIYWIVKINDEFILLQVSSKTRQANKSVIEGLEQFFTKQIK